MSKEEVRSRLAEAGWESVVFEGSSYWRSPDTGRMYPQEPAYDVLRRVEEMRRSQVENPGRGREGAA
jgi:hypothetical protein